MRPPGILFNFFKNSTFLNTHTEKTTMFTLSENHLLRVETVKKNGILHVNRFFLLNVMEVENNNNNNKKKKTFINLFGLYGARPEQQQKKKIGSQKKKKKKKKTSSTTSARMTFSRSLFA